VTQPYEPDQSSSDVVVIDETEDENTARDRDASGHEVLNGTVVDEPTGLADSDNSLAGDDPDSDEDDLLAADDDYDEDEDQDQDEDQPSEVVVVEEVASDSYEPSHAADLVEPRVAASREWLDIQAMFVDDPRGAVQLAATQADSALSALVTALQEQQAALAPASATVPGDGMAADPAETEQLRSALRGYRSLCQSLADMAGSLDAAESPATAA
jgi:hypothetical protein